MPSSQVGEVGKKSLFWGGLGETNRNWSLYRVIHYYYWCINTHRLYTVPGPMFLSLGCFYQGEYKSTESKTLTALQCPQTLWLLDHLTVSLQETWNTFCRPMAK